MMKIKKIWKKFCQNIILKIIVFFSVFGCQVQESYNYKYKNDTDFDILIIFSRHEGHKNEFTVNKKSDFITNHDVREAGDTEAKIIFNNAKIIIYKNYKDEISECQTPNNLYCESSFERKKLGKNFYEIKYTITQEDYQTAQDCEGECE